MHNQENCMCVLLRTANGLIWCWLTVFKRIKHEKKMKIENAGNFRKPAKFFVGVAKVHIALLPKWILNFNWT